MTIGSGRRMGASRGFRCGRRAAAPRILASHPSLVTSRPIPARQGSLHAGQCFDPEVHRRLVGIAEGRLLVRTLSKDCARHSTGRWARRARAPSQHTARRCWSCLRQHSSNVAVIEPSENLTLGLEALLGERVAHVGAHELDGDLGRYWSSSRTARNTSPIPPAPSIPARR